MAEKALERLSRDAKDTNLVFAHAEGSKKFLLTRQLLSVLAQLVGFMKQKKQK